MARRLGLRLHTHLAETDDEASHCLARFGRRPLELMEELGWLGDDVWFAHAIHLDPAEVARAMDKAVRSGAHTGLKAFAR